MRWAAEYRSVMSPLYEGCIKYSSPRVRYLGGGLAAVLLTSCLLKKAYNKVQRRKNLNKIKKKREDLAARKKRLESR